MIARKTPMLAAAGTLLLLAGCSNNEEMDSLRSEIASVRQIATQADQKATTALLEAEEAQAAAAAALTEAQTANEKADRMFRSDLRK